MRKTLTLLAVLVGCFAWQAPGADKPDPTGTWVCNISQSKFGKVPKAQVMTLKVERNGDGFHSVQTIDDGVGGPKTVAGDWFMDGKFHPENVNATPNKTSTMSKWDGDALVAERKSDDGSYDQKIRITFSSDRKTATEHVTVKSPNGDSSSTLVWERQ
jgi:hypothetical protein